MPPLPGSRGPAAQRSSLGWVRVRVRDGWRGCRAARAQVIVVEDENGNIVRETMKDTDTLARYKTMHETLVYLSHLDHDDTEKQMLDKLRLQARTSPKT